MQNGGGWSNGGISHIKAELRLSTAQPVYIYTF